MKNITFLFLCLPSLLFAQFDYYGPKPFDEILKSNFTASWTPAVVSSIENKTYVAILDQATQTKAIMISPSSKSVLQINSIDSLSGSSATYGSMMRSLFQLVDKNTHSENDAGAGSGTYTPLADQYKINPVLHSYYSINANSADDALCTDGGSFYIIEEANTGYVLVEFNGSASSTTISAVTRWEYNASQDSVIEDVSWTTKYLMINGNALEWTTSSGSASAFFLADANDLIDLEIASASSFNPLGETYQPNATTAIPAMDSMENSQIIDDLLKDIDVSLQDQFDHSASATTAASAMLDAIETTLVNSGDSLRYPKQFYLDARENMLSHIIASTDIYNGRVGNNTVEHVYFTNASDDSGVPHPFMVIASHAVSARPNLLLDVNRPPGGSGGPGYAESQVTRHGKLGEFLMKIPIKDYGIISTLLDNDLSVYGDLASDFDDKTGNTTTKDVYNYASLASSGIAIDGVTIYPAYNNNLRFAVEDAEVTSSGIHVGGGLELHYHVDGHAFNGNGINLYNLDDYSGKNHPPVIGFALDGIALFGRYDASNAFMAGYTDILDEFGGHDHGDGFGYHYHAHTQSVTASSAPNPTFDEHFLLVGAWKGDINNIPGFNEVKTNQLKDDAIARYAGAAYTLGIESNSNTLDIQITPNPSNGSFQLNVKENFEITIMDLTGKVLFLQAIQAGTNIISLEKYAKGIYVIKGVNKNSNFIKKVILK